MIVTAFYEVGDAKVGGLLPTVFRAHAVSVAWAPALSPAKHVPVVDVGEGSPADFAKAGNISGKLLLVHSVVLETWDDLFAEYSKAPPVIDAAVKGKARLSRSSRRGSTTFSTGIRILPREKSTAFRRYW